MKRKTAFALLALALLPMAAPLLASTHPLAALWIRSFFSRLCHQDPSRSFSWIGSPVAVCVRCLGIYLGVPLALLLKAGKSTAARLLPLALLLNLIDVAMEALHWHGSLSWPRFALGLVLGLGAGALFPSARSPELTAAGRPPYPR